MNFNVAVLQHLAIPRERRRRLLTIALPIIGGMLSQNILNLVDIGMVSRLGDVALAATGVGSFANYLALAAVLGLASGVQAIAARRLGEGRDSETAIALNGGLLLALLIGVPLSTLLISLAPTVMPMLNPDPAVLEAGTPYVQIRLLAIAAVGMNFAFRGYWSAVHMTRLYFTTLLIMHSLNIFLNWVLIFGHLGAPALGVSGAAWATTISIYTGSAIYLLFAWRHARDHGFFRGLPRRRELARQIRLSLPASGQQLFFSGGLLVLIWILGRIGTAEVAAANVLMTLGLVVILPAMGFGIAAASMVGNALGRKEIDDAECWGWDAARLVFLINLAVAGLLLVLARPILAIFLHDPATLELAYLPLLLSAAIIAFDTAGMVLMNALHGAGATWRAMVISLLGQWVFFLPLAYVAGVTLGGGLLAVWIAQAGYRLGQALVFAWTWRRRRWALIEV